MLIANAQDGSPQRGHSLNPIFREKSVMQPKSPTKNASAAKAAVPTKHSATDTARATNAAPVVHFEVIGKNPEKLRKYYGSLFGWEFDTGGRVATEISDAGNYGFVRRITTPDGTGIPGGVGGGTGYDRHTIFYVGVPDIEAALQMAESLGGTRLLGPSAKPGGGLMVGHFADPEGNLIGVAGPK